jgi:hypothetical protein
VDVELSQNALLERHGPVLVDGARAHGAVDRAELRQRKRSFEGPSDCHRNVVEAEWIA